MEIKLIASIFHEMVRAAEERHGGKSLRKIEQYRALFEDAVQQAVANLESITFDEVTSFE